MSLLGMLLDASTIGNRNPFDDRYFNGGSKFALSGIKVDQDAALKLSTVWACTGLLSSAIACLPIQIIQRRKGSPVVVGVGCIVLVFVGRAINRKGEPLP